MPIYEYVCLDCKRRFSLFFQTFSAAEEATPVCPRCGSSNVRKLISRVSVMQSEESRLENLADPSNFAGLDENDPKSLARWMKKMTQEMGEDAGDLGDDFHEALDRLEAGQSPEEIEKEMPELAGGGEDVGAGDIGLD